jgi:hypothetical protein
MKAATKAILLGSLLALAFSSSSQAVCGIGSKVWAGNTSTGAKIMASITNFWTMKGISTTFEIAGCTASDNWFKKGKDAVTQFTIQNFDHLAANMARGHGEHLDALAQLIEIEKKHQPAFRELAQEHFEELFPHDAATVGEMLGTLSRLMAGSDPLSVYVEG